MPRRLRRLTDARGLSLGFICFVLPQQPFVRRPPPRPEFHGRAITPVSSAPRQNDSKIEVCDVHVGNFVPAHNDVLPFRPQLSFGRV